MFQQKVTLKTPQVSKQIQTLLNLGCLVLWKRYEITKLFSFWWNTLYVGHNPGLSVSKDGIRHYGAAIIEVVSKVERDIRGGDLDSNMSHPTVLVSLCFENAFTKKNMYNMGSTSQSQSWKSLSREKNLCFATFCRNRFFPIFLLT